MSVRNIPLFGAGFATPFFRAQWVRKSAAQPVLATLRLVDGEGMATSEFRLLWSKAFPARQPLPEAAVAEDDGRGTLEFWDVFL